ncbi:hypothetical protein Bca4012_089873 [Brassica carinata]
MVNREKLERELAISSHEILAARRVHAARLVLVRDTFLLSKFCPTQRQRQQKIIEIVIYPAGKQCRAQMISPSTAQPLLSV